MAEWKGVPYFFDANGLHEPLSVIVEKMPVVLIDTPFAWETIVGVLSSAAIAIWALISNFRLARLQNNYAIKKEKANAILVAISTYITNANLSIQSLVIYSRYISTGADVTQIAIEVNSFAKELNYEFLKIKLLLDDGSEYHQHFLLHLSELTNDLNDLKKIAINGSVLVKYQGSEISVKLDNLILESKEIIERIMNS